MFSSESFSLISNVTMCCFGANHIGVSIATVIAYNCPLIHISVTDFNANLVSQWSEKSFHTHEPSLEKMFRNCLNKNLMLTTDLRSAIILADIVLLAVEVPVEKSNGRIVLNIRELEEAARVIAKISESNKIIVQKCAAPLETFTFLKSILNGNKSKHVNFEILTNPEFFSEGSLISHLLNPSFVLIGHDQSPEAGEAAVTLAGIYSRWVPYERIKIMSNRSLELARMSINVLLAQETTSMGAIATICERSDMNVSEITKLFNKRRSLSNNCSEESFSSPGMSFNIDVLNLICGCQKKNMNSSASYWQEILRLNDYQKIRFKKKILSVFDNSLEKKKLAIFGLPFDDCTYESFAVNLTAEILKEGATLFLYDPDVATEQERFFEAMEKSDVENAQGHATFFQDPYKAAVQVHGIIFNTDSQSIRSLDFATIYRGMIKPAYIFDGKNTLDQDYLTKIGFIVKTIGRN